jgi:hypothetical protein
VDLADKILWKEVNGLIWHKKQSFKKGDSERKLRLVCSIDDNKFEFNDLLTII